MRVLLLLLSVVALTSCLPGPSEDENGPSAKERGEATLTEAGSVLPRVLDAMAGTRAEARAGWSDCAAMPSYQYVLDGVLSAPTGTPDSLVAARAALTEVGYQDATQIEGRLTMTKGDHTLTLREGGPAYGDGTWRFTFGTDCGPLRGPDRDHAEADNGQDVEFTP